jgi:hypothetical protein
MASSAEGGSASSVAEALPGGVPLVVFVGGPFSEEDRPWDGPFLKEVHRWFSLALDRDAADSLFGPLARAGFDLLKPGRVGLATGPGVAFFQAGDSLGMAVAVRSPKKWREALMTLVRRPLRSLKVQGACEAGWGVVDEGWEIAFARRPPWLYVLAGLEIRKQASEQLADLVSVRAERSLASRETFRRARDSGGLCCDTVIWMGAGALSMMGPDAEDWAEIRERWSGIAGRAGEMLESVVRLNGAALGLSVAPHELRADGLVCAEGTLLDALNRTVGQGSHCVIGPVGLGRRCPIWAVSILDWSLLARTVPGVAKALDRILGQWGDLFKLSGGQGRANGVAALGLCGLRSLPANRGAAIDVDPFEYLDGFLVLEVMGQNLPSQLAGRFLDAVGDVVRDGMRRVRRAQEDELSSVMLAGHRFFVALRRGAMIVATSRDALREARSILEMQDTETLAPGLLMGGAFDSRRIVEWIACHMEAEPAEPSTEDLFQEFERWGTTRIEVRCESAGLRVVVRQQRDPKADWTQRGGPRGRASGSGEAPCSVRS